MNNTNDETMMKEEDPELQLETAPTDDTDDQVVVVDVPRSWRRITTVSVVAIAMALGLTLGLVFGLQGSSSSSSIFTPVTSPEEQAQRQELLLQQCTNSSLALLQEEAMTYMLPTLSDASIMCPDFMVPWAPCRSEEPPELVARVYQNVCEASGGVAYNFTTPTSLICKWVSGGGIVGLELGSYTLCAAPSCDDSEPYFQDFGVDYAIRMLRKYRDLDCTADTEPTMNLITECQDKYEPTGTVSDVNGRACVFFTTLDSASCSDYCAARGGSCLFMGTDYMLMDDYEGLPKESCNIGGQYDETCACTM